MRYAETETYNQLSETLQGLRKPYGKEVEENGRGKDERKGVINESLLWLRNVDFNDGRRETGV